MKKKFANLIFKKPLISSDYLLALSSCREFSKADYLKSVKQEHFIFDSSQVIHCCGG